MLLEFYGWSCVHCHNMEPLIARLEKETGIKLKKYEVWRDENADNVKIMSKYDAGSCGGVPLFVNTDTNAIICGECPYEELKSWALSGPDKEPAA